MGKNGTLQLSIGTMVNVMQIILTIVILNLSLHLPKIIVNIHSSDPKSPKLKMIYPSTSTISLKTSNTKQYGLLIPLPQMQNGTSPFTLVKHTAIPI